MFSTSSVLENLPDFRSNYLKKTLREKSKITFNFIQTSVLSYLSISTLSDIHYSIPLSGITTVLTMTFLGLEARKNLPKVSISIFKYHGQDQCWGAGTFLTCSL